MTTTPPTTESRKVDHIRINLDENVQFPQLTTGLENFRFMHQTLPELNLSDVNITTQLMGKTLKSPLLISSMTGGTELAQHINRNLAEAAQTHQIAMGLGSQRAAVEDDALAASYDVRRIAPDILLFANIGAVQLNYGYNWEQCQRAVDMVEADALILHLNVLQEAVQPEGDTDFSNLLKKIEAVVRNLSVPIIAKEVGWGLSKKAAKDLQEVGIAALDVAALEGHPGAKLNTTERQQPSMHRSPPLSVIGVFQLLIQSNMPKK